MEGQRGRSPDCEHCAVKEGREAALSRSSRRVFLTKQNRSAQGGCCVPHSPSAEGSIWHSQKKPLQGQLGVQPPTA